MSNTSEPRLEGQDPNEVPPYMTEPRDPCFLCTGRQGVDQHEVEVVIERGVGWVRSKAPGHQFGQWRRMDDGGQHG